MKKKVVIGMSGGVDSSVAAYLLKEQGHEVIGAMMKLSDPPADQKVKRVSCCSLEDASDARRVCAQLDIPFYVINSKEEFKEFVIDPFVTEYLSGRTPNPCVRCNDRVKFEFFYAKAKALGADYIATGHYVNKDYDDQSQTYRLFRANDLKKDQSYFLFTMTQEELAHTLFPIGHLNKTEVRKIAADLGLRTSHKAESQEICFVSDNQHGKFIDRYQSSLITKENKTSKLDKLDKLDKSGVFVDSAGKTLGEHPGIHYFTPGQRRGTQVAVGERLYVKSIDSENNNITLSQEEELYTQYLTAIDVRWIRQLPSKSQVLAKIRYAHAGAVANISYEDMKTVKVHFEQAQRAIAPGQAIVFYQDNEVIGGGWIG